MSQFVQIILYLGALQGMLLSIFLFSVKANKLSNRLLGLLTLFWGILVGIFAFQFDGMYIQFPHLLKVFPLLLLTLFPLLYLQVKYLISKHKHFERIDLLHFVPLLLLMLLELDFFFMSGDEKIFLNQNPTLYYQIVQIIIEEVVALQGVVYSILALRLITHYKRRVLHYQSNIDKMILKFQYIGISLSLFAWIIGIIGIHLEYLHITVNVDLFMFVYLTLVLIIYLISFSALKSPEIYKLDEIQIKLDSDSSKKLIYDEPLVEESFAKSSYKIVQSFEEDPVSDKINNVLLDFIDIHKPYLNPELSLQELADQIDVKRHTLSNIINQKHKKNFYEFINQYRIEEVKSMMTNPKNKHFKLISLAYDSGFNSKATFNRIFKQMTGMTPSQFISTQKVA